MKVTKVLLRDTVANLGKVGDVVNVAPGYARNYLYPRGLAILATPDNVKVMARKRARLDAIESARLAEYEAVAAKIEGVRVEIGAKADETGSLYGSVGAAQIAASLVIAGHAVEERQIRLEHPLKAVGEHQVPVHVHGELNASITVVVVAESSAE